MQTMQKKGMSISRLTLGTVQLGIPYGINNQSGQPNTKNSYDILTEAWNGGVVSYDTAAAYGDSERILGDFFVDKHPVIITKLHLAPEQVDQARLLHEMHSKVQASLDSLSLKTLPILMLHNTEVLGKYGDEITAGFQALKQEGLVECAGISISSNMAHEYQMIWDYLQDSTYEAVQLPMNIFDHRPMTNGCLQMLSALDKLIFVRSVFLQGLIYMEEHDLPDCVSELREPIVKLKALAQKYEMSLSQIAVSYIRDLHGVHSIVIGAETTGQVQDNIRWMDGPPIPMKLREEIMTCFRNIPELAVTPAFWKK